MRELCAYQIGVLNMFNSINYDQTHFITSFRCYFLQVNMVWRPTDTVAHVVLDAVRSWASYKSKYGNSIAFTFAFRLPSKSHCSLFERFNVHRTTQIPYCVLTGHAKTSRIMHWHWKSMLGQTNEWVYIYLRHFSCSYRWAARPFDCSYK